MDTKNTAIWALLGIGLATAPPTFAEIVEYQFTGAIWDAPNELLDLVNDPLVFTMRVDTSIAGSHSAENIYNVGQYSNSILSLSVKAGDTTVATATSGNLSIVDYFGYDGQSAPKDYFQLYAGTHSDPVHGLTPTRITLNLISYDYLHTLTSSDWPFPFPSPLEFAANRTLYVDFSGGQKLGYILTGVTTTIPTPLPAGVWLLASVLAGGLGFMSRQRAGGGLQHLHWHGA